MSNWKILLKKCPPFQINHNFYASSIVLYVYCMSDVTWNLVTSNTTHDVNYISHSANTRFILHHCTSTYTGGLALLLLQLWMRQICMLDDRLLLDVLRSSRQLLEYLVATVLYLQWSILSWWITSTLPPDIFFLLWWQHRLDDWHWTTTAIPVATGRLLSPPHLCCPFLLSADEDDDSFQQFHSLQQHTWYELDDGHSVCVELLDTFGWYFGSSDSFPLVSMPLFLTNISVKTSVAVAKDSVRSESGTEPDSGPSSLLDVAVDETGQFFNSLLWWSFSFDMIDDPKDLPRCLVDGLLLIKSSGGGGGVGVDDGKPLTLQCFIVVQEVVVVVVTLLSITNSAVLDEKHSESSSLVSWDLKKWGN